MIGCYSRSLKNAWIFHGFHCPFLLKGRRFIGTHRTAQDVYSEAWLHAHFPFNPMFLYRSSENSVAPPFFLLADTRQWMTMGVFQSHGRSWSRLKRHRPWMPWIPWMHLGAEVIDLLSRSPTTCGVPTATVNLTRPVFGWPVYEARFWPNWTIRLSGHVFYLAVPHINQQQWGFSQISPAQSDTKKSRFKQSNLDWLQQNMTWPLCVCAIVIGRSHIGTRKKHVRLP